MHDRWMREGEGGDSGCSMEKRRRRREESFSRGGGEGIFGVDDD